mmetsp:Transcript_4595/g.11817  ORF Transcript_4595/g.11817 Transcript_4595/m.11817 type:complete len:115 (-) Transcript_4595:130-474(-)
MNSEMIFAVMMRESEETHHGFILKQSTVATCIGNNQIIIACMLVTLWVVLIRFLSEYGIVEDDLNRRERHLVCHELITRHGFCFVASFKLSITQKNNTKSWFVKPATFLRLFVC